MQSNINSKKPYGIAGKRSREQGKYVQVKQKSELKKYRLVEKQRSPYSHINFVHQDDRKAPRKGMISSLS